jgi:hypothetical protein
MTVGARSQYRPAPHFHKRTLLPAAHKKGHPGDVWMVLKVWEIAL